MHHFVELVQADQGSNVADGRFGNTVWADAKGFAPGVDLAPDGVLVSGDALPSEDGIGSVDRISFAIELSYLMIDP
jgi:hypothetical protein